MATSKLRPVIRHLLRTDFCIPHSIFLVEAIDIIPSLSDSSVAVWRAVRLVLGDGELCIQALLSPLAHCLVDRDEIRPGAILRLDTFSLCRRRLRRSDNVDATLVFLVVPSLVIVGWAPVFPFPTTDPPGAVRRRDAGDQHPDLEYSDGADGHHGHDNDDDGDGDFFELMTPPSPLPTSRTPLPRILVPSSRQPVALARDWAHPDHPLRLTTLSAMPNLPYKQNWSLNLVAIVTSLTPIEPCAYPADQQRRARLTDPSTSREILLTVFLDPDNFTPRLGVPLLFVGVKNHLFEGGSLRKYASDPPRPGMSWWYQEPDMTWCTIAVDALRAWWRLRSAEPASDKDDKSRRLEPA